MSIVRGAVRVVTETANATTAAAGALGGAAVSGVVGGVQGTLGGIRNGLGSGSHSTPAALLTLGALGATGLVEWPVVLTVGGAALILRQLGQRFDGEPAKPAPKASPQPPASSRQRTQPRKSATKAARTSPRKATRTRRPRTRA
jgi:hypothetical protein